VGLPAAYVPLPVGNGEQRLNAMPIVTQGGGMIVDDAELTAGWIMSSLLPVLTNVDRVVAMSEAATRLGRRDADRALARAVIEVVASSPARAAATRAALPSPGVATPRGMSGGGAKISDMQSPPGEPGGRAHQSAPMPEGGFFQPTQERAASQRAASSRQVPGTGQSHRRHRHGR
jgi:hypothetical protein